MSAPGTDSSPQTATKASGFNYAELLSRILVLSLLFASAGLLWWSYYRVYVPRLVIFRDLSSTVDKLAREVEDLDRQWSKQDIERINQKFELVQAKIFVDQADLDAWLVDIRDPLIPLGLNLKTEFTKPTLIAGEENRFHTIHTTFNVGFQPLGSSTNKLSPYQRLLQFTKRITTQEKRADLTELNVESGTNSIGRAVMTVNFWVGTRETK